ncbi:AAA family ATPase [Amycolatopsis sp. FU40]|uniref:SARP transcriptional regulator n=1 Tax=Amycolatopsis sp. FU40 TaxID=2914159 RepID=G4XIM0_9PSEU|nr:AfsR/SARP family transcriptional regulator [Amycolatopsis sp. FU40]AEP40927.1 SARP transcriptional regulator [Amycolatopsis sp. FU40]UKD51733.1 AAA family ATPase [Amycolatopsis sp. FU40]
MRVGDEAVEVRSARHRAVLASLLLSANREVSVETLIRHVWGERPSGSAVAALRVLIMRVRRSLGEPGLIRTSSSGYVIDVDNDGLDLLRFRGLTERAKAARTAGALDRAAHLLDRALAEWRGPALSDVASESLHASEVPLLLEDRLRAAAERVDVNLQRGRHHEVIGELRRLTQEYPLREQFWAQFMLALHLSDRRDEALVAYREVRRRLAEEVGIDPGPVLRSVYRAVVGDGPRIAEPASLAVPCQLPPVASSFFGREAEAGRLRELLQPAPDRISVPIVTVCGPPGVGKTALATQVAHELRAAYPDGQLWVDLRGHAANPPLSTTAALTGFLRSLSVPAAGLPEDQDELVAAYRSALSGRRVLVVLDNAADTEQVRPLLPGGPGCAVVVTSRDELRGLTVLNGGVRVRVDVPSPGEAAGLLSAALGDDPGYPAETIGELADLCGHLPLALRIAASNLVGKSRSHLEAYAARLRAGNRVSVLSVGDDDKAAVLTAFEHSYRSLGPAAKRVLHLLALLPGADIAEAAVAAATDQNLFQAGRTLEELAGVSLVQRRGHDRYRVPHLLADYVALLPAVRGEQLRRDRHRLFDWYSKVADRATGLLYPDLPRTGRPLPDEAGPAPEVADRATAFAWLETERPTLAAVAVRWAGHATGHLGFWQFVERVRVHLAVNQHPELAWVTEAARLAARKLAESTPRVGGRLDALSR